MAEITPEECPQKIKEHLLEDLAFEPERVRNFYTSNIFMRALSHLVGWTGKRAKMLRCTQAGELKTAPTSTGIEHNDTQLGDAGDIYGPMVKFDQVVSRMDIFIWDNPVAFKRSIDGTTYDMPIEIPVGFYSVDAVTVGFAIRNNTEGQAARYQVVGWW